MKFGPFAQHMALGVALIVGIPLSFNFIIRHQLNKIVDAGVARRLQESTNSQDVAKTNFALKSMEEVFDQYLAEYHDVDFPIKKYDAIRMWNETESMQTTPLRFLTQSSTQKPKRVYAAKGAGSVYWLAGTLTIDYPFSCRCDSVKLSTFHPDEFSMDPVASPVNCASSGSSSLIPTKSATCDATNSATSSAWVSALFICFVGSSWLIFLT